MRAWLQRRRHSAALTAFEENSWEVAFGVLFILAALSLVSAGSVFPTGPGTFLPLWLVWGWEAALALGGVTMIAGLAWRGTQVVGRAVERAGLYLTVAAWGSIAFTLTATAPSLYAAVIAQAVTVVAGGLGRIFALRRVDRVVDTARAVAGEDVIAT